MDKKVSPLKVLAALHYEKMKLPTRVVPLSKVVTDVTESLAEPLKTESVIAESIEPVIATTLPTQPISGIQNLIPQTLHVKDSTLVLNLNFNLDSESIRNAVENSARLMTGLAAGAAMLGTAFVFNSRPTRVNPLSVKLPNMRKTRIPRIPKETE